MSQTSGAPSIPTGVSAEDFSRLLWKGRARGTLAVEEVIEVLKDTELSPELIDSVRRRLAVEDADSDLDDVLGRLADEAAKRAVADLEAAFRTSADPMAYAADLAWLKLTLEELHADRITAVEATGRLVRWLVTRFEVDG